MEVAEGARVRERRVDVGSESRRISAHRRKDRENDALEVAVAADRVRIHAKEIRSAALRGRFLE